MEIKKIKDFLITEFMMKKLLVLIMLTTLSTSVFAARTNVTAKVTQIIVDDSRYGGCMARLNVNPATSLAACGNWYVTMDCLAEFPESTKSGAAQKLSAAQLAYVANKSVKVNVDDSRKANGFCVAIRIDNL